MRKKIFFIIIFCFLILSFTFSSDFKDSINNYVGKKIKVFLTDSSGQYTLYFVGVLEEVLEDHIKLSSSKNNSIYFIKLENISSFIIMLEKKPTDDENNNKKKKRK